MPKTPESLGIPEEEKERARKDHGKEMHEAQEKGGIPPESFPEIVEKAFQKPPEPKYPLEPSQETLLLIGELGKELTPRQRTLLELQFYFGEKGADLYAKTLKGEREEALDPQDEEELKASLEELLGTYEDILIPGTEYSAALEMLQESQSDLEFMKNLKQPTYAIWLNFADRIEKFHQPLLLRETDSLPQQQRLTAIQNQIKDSILARIPKMIPPPQAAVKIPIRISRPALEELVEKIRTEEEHRLEEVPIPIAKEKGLKWRDELLELLAQKGERPTHIKTGKIIKLQGPKLENLLGSSEITILLPTENLPISIRATDLRQGERPHFVRIQKDGVIQTRVDYYGGDAETLEKANQTKAIPPERWERFIEKVVELAQKYEPPQS